MIAKLFEVLTDIVDGVLTLIPTTFDSIVKIFYVEETGFTFVGSLALLGLGMSLAFFGWKVVKGLLKR